MFAVCLRSDRRLGGDTVTSVLSSLTKSNSLCMFTQTLMSQCVLMPCLDMWEMSVDFLTLKLACRVTAAIVSDSSIHAIRLLREKKRLYQVKMVCWFKRTVD